MLKAARYIKHCFEGCIVYAYFLIFALLPIDLASLLSGRMLRAIGLMLPARNIARSNIRLCFPKYSEEQINQIISQMWDNLGRVIGELPHWHRISKEEFARRVTLIDDSNGAFKSAKNSIFVSAHYGNWELFPRFVSEYGMKFSMLYRPANNKIVDSIVNKQRAQCGISLIEKGIGGMRGILKALKSGHLIGMLVDQKTNNGIEVPFFGWPAMTTPAPANLAIKLKSKIFMIHTTRLSGANYLIHVSKPIEACDTDDTISITAKINEEIEKWIRHNPSQWFWVHRRWDKSLYK